MPAAAPSGARDRVALFVLQAGAIAIVLIAMPYKAFDLDRYFVPKELVLHLCAAVAAIRLIAARGQITMRGIDMLLALYLIESAISAVFATNGWAAERALAISVSGAALFWAASALGRAGSSRPLLVALAIAVVVASATSLAQAYGVQSEYFSLNRVPGGTFGNRNFVAHLAAIGAPAVMLVALTAPRGLGSVFAAISMAIVSATLFLSRSRAAWLAMIAVAIVVAVLGKISWARWSDSRTIRRMLVLGIAAAAGVLGAIVLPNHLDWKSSSPYLDSAAGLVNYKEGSGRGRIVQYTNSLKMSRAYTLLGVGPGNWPVIYPKFASRNDPSMSQSAEGVTSNPWPSSDWAAFVSERGFVGFALLLLVFLGLTIRAIRDFREGGGRDPERVLTPIALLGTLVATAVVGAFDAVLMIAVPTFFVWTLSGALRPPTGGAEVEVRVPRFVAPLLAVVAVVIIGRSAGQAGAIAMASTNTSINSLARSTVFDPGNYRLRTRLAQAYIGRGDCTRARPEARAARDLFPSAAEPKRYIAQCGGR
jgi:O-antigen ligase